MASAEKLIQVNCQLRARLVLERGGEIGRSLTVQEAEFLQFRMIQGAKTRARAVYELFQPVPVSLSLFNPLDGNHAPST